MLGTARLNEATGQYEYLGQGIQRARQRQLGFWLQDAWRLGAELHVELRRALRYDVPVRGAEQQLLHRRLDDVFGVSGVGNLFKPGTLTGSSADVPPAEGE